MRAIFFNKLGRRRITYMISIQSVKLACFVFLFLFLFFFCFVLLFCRPIGLVVFFRKIKNNANAIFQLALLY